MTRGKMNKKDFKKLVARDQYCLHCGETEAIAPNHRINRGMGGSKKLDHWANLVILCSILNGQIEADSRWAAMAESYGYKLRRHQDPKTEPVFDAITGVWYLLDDDLGRKVVKRKDDNDRT